MDWFIDWFATMDAWKFIGLAGQVIFGSRFFVQWYASERAKRSVIPLAFWHISVFGGVLILVYSVYIREPAFILSQVVGLAIYVRNLVFVYRHRDPTM